MSNPDMRIPIQYAITYPDKKTSPVKPISFTQIQKLEFYKPDVNKFPCLKLALQAAKKGGSYPTVLNAVDEVCVASFIEGKIKFTDIPKIVEKVLLLHRGQLKPPTISQTVEIDEWAKQKTIGIINAKMYM